MRVQRPTPWKELIRGLEDSVETDMLRAVHHAVVVILEPPPSHPWCLTDLDTPACVCVCVFGLWETSPPRCEAQSPRRQVQLTQTGSLAGRASLGHRGGENEGETTEEKATGTHTNTRSDLRTAPNTCMCPPFSRPRTGCDNTGTGVYLQTLS